MHLDGALDRLFAAFSKPQVLRDPSSEGRVSNFVCSTRFEGPSTTALFDYCKDRDAKLPI